MIYKFYRKFFELKDKAASRVKIWHLSFKYPNLKITGNSYIGKNCHIVCEDGGAMVLHNAHINFGTFLHCSKNATFHINSSYIGMHTVIVATKKISISNSEIAEMVVIRDQNHKHNLTDTPIKEQGYESSSIILHKNVWVRAKATILKGVEIGKNSIIGANAVVNKSFPNSSIIIGIPAKKIN